MLPHLGTGQRGVTEAPAYTTAVVTRQTRSFLPENLLPVAEVFGPEGHPEHVHLTIRVDVPRQGNKFSAFFSFIFSAIFASWIRIQEVFHNLDPDQHSCLTVSHGVMQKIYSVHYFWKFERVKSVEDKTAIHESDIIGDHLLNLNL